MASKKRAKIDNKNERKGKRKLGNKFKSKSLANFLILTTLLLAIILIVELAQVFLQFKNLTKKAVNNQRPVYVVEGQPIDIDVYLREYFVT